MIAKAHKTRVMLDSKEEQCEQKKVQRGGEPHVRQRRSPDSSGVKGKNQYHVCSTWIRDTDEFTGRVVIFTLNIATRPSTALMPSTPTVRLWLIPSLVLARRPGTKMISLWYVYPFADVVPLYVVWLVKSLVGISDWVMFPISQSLNMRT